MLRILNLSLIVILLFLCISCANKTLWESTGPDKYVKIKYTKITEEEIKASGAEYLRDDDKKAFYVGKNFFDTSEGYSYKNLTTPLTITIGTTSVVVFAVAYLTYPDAVQEALDEYCAINPNCSNNWNN